MESLYTLSIRETARRLIDGYFHPGMRINPFRQFPPNILHDLISCVCMETQEDFHSTNILLLLRTGRVRNLEIQNVRLDEENADGIFDEILPFSRVLRTIQLINIDATFDDVRPTFSTLLRRSRHLECLETCLKFNFADINFCFYLRKLVLDFSLHHNAFAPEAVPDTVPLNRCLKVLKISSDLQAHQYILGAVAIFLQYFVELVELGCDCTRPSLFLRERGIDSDSTKFKLRKSELGDDHHLGASEDGIEQTARYCPDLSEVTVAPLNPTAVRSLSDFHHIVSLTLCEATVGVNDYRIGIRLLLQHPHFATNLKYLKITRYSRVSISSIGASCPNLEELWLHSISEDTSVAFVPRSFRKLHSLWVEILENSPCSEASLIGCLSNATALEFVTITNSSRLTDRVLGRILEHRLALTSVNTITILSGGFTLRGFRRLAERLSGAKYLVMNLRNAQVLRLTLAVLDTLNLSHILQLLPV